MVSIIYEAGVAVRLSVHPGMKELNTFQECIIVDATDDSVVRCDLVSLPADIKHLTTRMVRPSHATSSPEPHVHD